MCMKPALNKSRMEENDPDPRPPICPRVRQEEEPAGAEWQRRVYPDADFLCRAHTGPPDADVRVNRAEMAARQQCGWSQTKARTGHCGGLAMTQAELGSWYSFRSGVPLPYSQ